MYVAEYQSESFSWKQIAFVINTVVENSKNSDWNDHLDKWIELISSASKIYLALRFSVIQGKLKRVILIQYQELNNTEISILVDVFLHLNFIHKDSVVIPNNAKEHDAIIESFSQLKYWHKPLILERNRILFINYFRISDYFHEVLAEALRSGRRLDYQINIRHYSLPTGVRREILKNIARVEEESDIPEILKEDQSKRINDASSCNALIDEFIGVDEYESTKYFNQLFSKIHNIEMNACKLPIIEASFDQNNDFNELIQLGLHSSLAIELPPLNQAASSVKIHNIMKLLHIEASLPTISSLFKNYLKYKKEGDINMITKTKILFLGSNPMDSYLKLDEEVKRIQINLKLAKERDNLILKQEWAVTIDTLMQAMLDESPDFVHFSGHGKQEGIILHTENGEAKMVSTEALVGLFKLFKDNIKCVILNSCYSEVQAKAIKLYIPYVIGMKIEIPDNTAIAFSTGFYKAIGAGKNIPFAFEMGITAIKLEGVTGDSIPILL